MKVCLVTCTGIYKITSPSGRVYIGQSFDIRNRWYKYKSNLCEKQYLIYNSLKKYGYENHTFEVIHELPKDISQEVMDIYEQSYMDLYRDCKVSLLNLKEGGSRGKLSEESKRRVSQNRKGKNAGENCHMYGTKRSQETKDRISRTKSGVLQTEEHNKKISESLKRAYAEGRRNKKI